MSPPPSAKTPVAVVGAGIMGTGIAQVAAQGGHPVVLLDNRAGAARQALQKLTATLGRLQAKGKFDADQVAAILARITVAEDTAAVAGCGLVIEAIVENAEAKQALLAELEQKVADDCILASNTSSISITRLARGLRHPERVVGMHFFNPVPVMRLVEVVTGLQTTASVAEATAALAASWGKTPVRAKSTPGFIVNRIARPYYAEGLALLQEGACSPDTLDTCLRAAGFRMGPCELMDLIGHDTNFAVTNSVYAANFYDKRYVPSLVQRELVEGGLLGRKTGRGFYTYASDGTRTDSAPNTAAAKPAATDTETVAPLAAPPHHTLALAGADAMADRLGEALTQAGLGFDRVPDADWTGLVIDHDKQLRLTDGRTASRLGRHVAVFDQAIATATSAAASGAALAFAVSVRADDAWRTEAPQWLSLLGFTPVLIDDTPGLIVARTLAMLINEAADAVQQQVCSQADADTAMKLGVNYPAGPFRWLDALGAGRVVTLLDALDAYCRGERYRVSPWLRRRA
ncbi:3-hydroxybutyryl-CoA dehydrogenase OS=Castellaniella defragrans OX=75697 GN=HNR28_000094 PE=4 SV=1 [Castellaniella defragrans]